MHKLLLAQPAGYSHFAQSHETIRRALSAPHVQSDHHQQMLPQSGHTTTSYSPPPPSAQFPSASADYPSGNSSSSIPQKSSTSPSDQSFRSSPETPASRSDVDRKLTLPPPAAATVVNPHFTGPRPESLLAPSAPSLPQPYHENPSQPLADSLSLAESPRHPRQTGPAAAAKQHSSMLEPDHREIRLTRTGRISKALKGQAVHRCEQCGKVYTRLEHLRRHQRNHGTILRCEIDGCDKVFHRHDMLERHRENGHKVLPNRKRIVPRPSDELQQQPHYPYPQSSTEHPESAAYTPHMTAPSASSAASEQPPQSSTATPSTSQPSQRPQLTLSTAPAAHRLPSIQSLLNDEAPISPLLPPPTGAFKSPMSAQPFAGSAPTSPAALEHPQSAFPSPGPYFTSQTGPTPTSARRPYQYPPPPPPPATHQSSHSPENDNAKISTPKSQYPPHPAPRPNGWQGHHSSRSLQLQQSPGPNHATTNASPPAKRQRLSEERKITSSPPQVISHEDSQMNDVMPHMSRRWAPQPAASH